MLDARSKPLWSSVRASRNLNTKIIPHLQKAKRPSWMGSAADRIRIPEKAPWVPPGMQAGTLPGRKHMPKPKISFSLCVDVQHGVGFLVRIQTGDGGAEVHHLLSRKDGSWICTTVDQIREHDIPSACIFPVDEMLPAALELTKTRQHST